MISNPLGAAQARLVCSAKRHLQIAVGYPIGVALLTLMVYRASQPMPVSTLATGFVAVMAGIQFLLLVPVSAGAIRRAIQRDYASGMVESHRLTAMGSSTVILGYLTGATAQAFTLAGANFAMGMVAAAFIPNRPFAEWAIANFFVICVAFVLWSMTAFTAVATQGKNNLVGVLMAFGIMGGIAAFHALPPLLLVIGPILMLLRFRGVATGVTPPPELLLSIPLQIALGFTFCAAAARKYRRADVQGFDAALGLVLLGLAAAACVGGQAMVNGIRVAIPGQPLSAPDEALMLASSVFLTVVSMVPIAAAAQASGRWERRRLADAGFVDPAPRGYLLVALAAIGMLMLSVMLGDISRHVARGVSVTARNSGACLCLGLLGFAGFLRRSYAARDRAWFGATAYLLVAWALPIVIEVVFYVYGNASELERRFTPVMAFSPVGAAFAITRELDILLWPGLATQCGLALLLCARRNRGTRGSTNVIAMQPTLG